MARSLQTAGSTGVDVSQSRTRPDADGRDVTRWMVGCAVGAAATIGVGILVFLIALALQPPAWVQIVVGVGLALGATVFTWLVASAWGGRSEQP